MLEKFKYINHLGETLEFGKSPLFVNENDLRDFSWDVTKKNNKISGFSKGIVSKTIPIILKAETKDEAKRMKNRLFEVFEKDVLAEKYGRIVVGDYYLKCYVVDSSKSEYLLNECFMAIDLKIQTDLPNWVRDTSYKIRMTESNEGKEFLDYPHGTPFDYMVSLGISEVNNPAVIASDWSMMIYGATVNPSIIIGNHEYSFNISIGNSEYLTVDSKAKTIVLTKVNGEKINCFNSRNKDAYVFEKIPPGINVVASANEGIKFDITLFEERSEPEWI